MGKKKEGMEFRRLAMEYLRIQSNRSKSGATIFPKNKDLLQKVNTCRRAFWRTGPDMGIGETLLFMRKQLANRKSEVDLRKSVGALLQNEERGLLAPAQELLSFYDSWEWKRLRYDFLKDRCRRCQCCGATPESGAKIVVDHVKPIRFFWELRLDSCNLQILCDDCNMGKGSRDRSDWRSTEDLIEAGILVCSDDVEVPYRKVRQ